MLVKFRNKAPRKLGLCTGHVLIPGRKVVQEIEMSEEQYRTICGDTGFRSWQKLGWVSIIQESEAVKASRFEEPVVPKAVDVLQGLTVSQAKAKIVNTDDIDLLSVWHAKDHRKGIKKAIESRIEDLEKVDEFEEDED